MEILISRMVVPMFDSGLLPEKPCDESRTSRYCFPCISGICPFDMDFLSDCYPGLDPELIALFDELFLLRSRAAYESLKKHEFLVRALR
jgi:hypothetical protein